MSPTVSRNEDQDVVVQASDLHFALNYQIKSIETGEHQIQFENPSPGIYFINAEGNGILFTGKSILIPAK